MIDMLKRDLNLRLVGVRGDFMICKIRLKLIFYDCMISWWDRGRWGGISPMSLSGTGLQPGPQAAVTAPRKKSISILKVSTNSDTVRFLGGDINSTCGKDLSLEP